MKYCTSCGKQIDDNDKFCPYCGAAQENEQATTSYTGKKKSYTGWVVFVFVITIVLIVSGLIWWGYEETKPASEKSQSSTSCSNPLIKGNISKTGEKIYHNPEDEYYSRTEIDESAGEKMFCSEEEAKQAGWRHSEV